MTDTNNGAIDATGMTPATKTDLAATAQANAPRLAVDAATLAALPEATRNAFLATAQKYGLTPPAADTTGNSAPAITPPTSSAGLAGRLFPNAGIPDEKIPGAVANLQKHWTGDPAVLREAMNRAGVVQKQVETPPALDPAKLDPVLDPPAKMDGYKFDYTGIEGVNAADTEALAKLDGTLRTALHAAGVSVADANEVVREGLKTGNALQGKSEAQVKAHNQEIFKTLSNLVGTDKIDAVMTQARDALWRAPEALRKELIANSFTKNVRVILSLAAAQTRYLARNASK